MTSNILSSNGKSGVAQLSHLPSYESHVQMQTNQQSEKCSQRNLISIIIGLIFLLLLASISIILILNFNNGQHSNEETTESKKILIWLMHLFIFNFAGQGPNHITAVIDQGQCITRNDVVVSERSCFYLVLQSDGNLVIFRQNDHRAVWATDTLGTDASRACMQSKLVFLKLT